LFAPLAGSTSCGASVEQFAACATVKRDFDERVPAHCSVTDSTNHVNVPGGNGRMTEVLLVLAMSAKSFPFTEAKTRYSVASAIAVQTKVTGETTLFSPSAGVTGSGASLPHRFVCGLTKVAFDEATGVQESKNASTYH